MWIWQHLHSAPSYGSKHGGYEVSYHAFIYSVIGCRSQQNYTQAIWNNNDKDVTKESRVLKRLWYETSCFACRVFTVIPMSPLITFRYSLDNFGYVKYLSVSRQGKFMTNVVLEWRKSLPEIRHDHSHCGRIAKHLTWIGFSTTYGSGSNQNWKDQIPFGLCCSHSHDKSHVWAKKYLIWATFTSSVNSSQSFLNSN